MNMGNPFITLHQDPQTVLEWVRKQIWAAGLEVICTFDLQLARKNQQSNTCPQHGSMACNCQLMILMVYKSPNAPISLIGYGDSSCTSLSVINTPEQQADPLLFESLREILSLDGYKSSK